MCSFLKKARKLSLPLDIKPFNLLVKPGVLYEAEVWGNENGEIFKDSSLDFLNRYFL